MARPFRVQYTGRRRWARMKKYRAGKIKQEHHIIPGIRPILEQIERCPDVKSVLPGPIRPLRARLEMTFQYFTDTGLKLLAKNGSAIQEIFLTTADRDAVRQWLEDEAIIAKEAAPAPARRPNAPVPMTTVVLPSDIACERCGRMMRAGARVAKMGRKNHYYVHTRCART